MEEIIFEERYIFALKRISMRREIFFYILRNISLIRGAFYFIEEEINEKTELVHRGIYKQESNCYSLKLTLTKEIL